VPSARSRPFLYVISAVLIVAAAYLCFELGRYQAAYSLLDHRHEVATLNERLKREQATSDELRRQLAIAQTSGEIDRETYSQVESNLSDLQAKIQAQEEELVFYRGIVSPQDGVAGLRIQSVEVLPGDGERRYLLRVVLVQAIVHSRRVSGTVKLELEGSTAGETTTYDVAELVAGDGDYDMAYEFRYFEGLEVELSLPLGFEPQRINVEIWPSEARAERLSQSFQWSVVAG
jgi:cell division protein FtsL